ncbi:MAG: YbjQ family protein [Nitrospiria bacterium]
MKRHEILLCTTNQLEGYRIEAYYGLVSAHVTSGVNALRGWLIAIRDIVGGRSGSYEKELVRLEERAIAQLLEKAGAVGANAILGLRWDYSNIGGDRRSLLMLVATGTACRVKGL